jgi:capsular polysaccharide biosynthesis protein
MPVGARTIDAERFKEACPSHPVLPNAHPLLATPRIEYRGTWVRRYESVKVYGPTVSVVDDGGQLLADVSVEWGREAEENWTFRRRALPKPEMILGKTLVLASTGGGTFFHWMTDVLTRIGLARRAGFDPTSFDHVLVNAINHPFQQESLKHLGIPANRCWEILGKEVAYELEEVVLPSLPGVPGVVPPETVEFLQGTFSPKKTGRGRKIFIGRGEAKHRPLLHEGEISGNLLKRGFESVDCGQLSLQKQAEVFGAAEIVVGAHGAALTNLVFCRPGTRVVELFSPQYVNPCYRDLCVAADLKHAAVIGDGKDWVLSEKHDQPSGPITASWELVEEALRKLSC